MKTPGVGLTSRALCEVASHDLGWLAAESPAQRRHAQLGRLAEQAWPFTSRAWAADAPGRLTAGDQREGKGVHRDAFIADVNLERRDLTKGQKAMLIAIRYPNREKGGRGKVSEAQTA